VYSSHNMGLSRAPADELINRDAEHACEFRERVRVRILDDASLEARNRLRAHPGFGRERMLREAQALAVTLHPVTEATLRTFNGLHT
jgi:hypothetical protein